MENHYTTHQKRRGFEVANGWEDKEINLPIQSTEHSAGYDFESAEDIVIPSIWRTFFNGAVKFTLEVTKNFMNPYPDLKFKHDIHEDVAPKLFKPVLVPTGIKSYMQGNEALFLYNRSSNPLKSFLLLANGVGVIDSDYYENPDNDGHIMFQFLNFGIFDKKIQKGERIGQGVFQLFLKADDGSARHSYNKRKGGHGSTNS